MSSEDQNDIVFIDHPDDGENELADGAEVDALTKDLDPAAPTLTGEDDEPWN